MAVEEPKFVSVLKDGPFEVRDYAPRTEARVTLDETREAAMSRGFSVLAGYIFGSNAQNRKIAMTAPVLMAPDTPAPQPNSGTSDWTISFVMPAGMTAADMPPPGDPRIRFIDFAPARMAILRFSGSAGADRMEKKRADLTNWMAGRNLIPAGPPSLARYDPPWIPPFLRRNEVMIPIHSA
jgi:hypothetical protein